MKLLHFKCCKIESDVVRTVFQFSSFLYTTLKFSTLKYFQIVIVSHSLGFLFPYLRSLIQKKMVIRSATSNLINTISSNKIVVIIINDDDAAVTANDNNSVKLSCTFSEGHGLHNC